MPRFIARLGLVGGPLISVSPTALMFFCGKRGGRGHVRCGVAFSRTGREILTISAPIPAQR